MTRLLPLTAALLLFGAVHFTNAAIVHLDFGLTGQDVQVGYVGVSGSSANSTSPFTVPSAALPGGETISISTNTGFLTFRDRGNFSVANYGPEGDVFEDYVRVGTGAAAGGVYSTMTIAIGGLEPATPYEFTLQIYDGGISGTQVGTYSYTITGSGDANPLNNSYSMDFHSNAPGFSLEARGGYTETLFADAFGEMIITIEQTGGGESTVPLNALKFTAVPEPGCASMGLVGAAFLAAMRRRRSERLVRC